MVAQHFECAKRHRIVYFKMANFMVRGISLKTKIRWMSASRVNWGGGQKGEEKSGEAAVVTQVRKDSNVEQGGAGGVPAVALACEAPTGHISRATGQEMEIWGKKRWRVEALSTAWARGCLCSFWLKSQQRRSLWWVGAWGGWSLDPGLSRGGG